MIKKTFVIFLVALMLLPNFSFAFELDRNEISGDSIDAALNQIAPGGSGGADVITGSRSNGASNILNSSDSILPGSGAGDLSDAETASDIAGGLNCGDTPGGGSFQRALSRYGARLGDAALNGIAGAISGRGPAGRAAGDILRGAGIGDVAVGLGEDAANFAGGFAGDFVDEKISGACGDSSLGQKICGRIGNVVGNFVEGQVTQIGGQLISQGLQSLGISQLGGFLGGAAGGIFGGILGGGEISTKDKSAIAEAKKVVTQATKARQNSDTQIQLVCEKNPLAVGFARSIQNDASATAISTAAKQQQRNPAEELETAGIAGATRYADTITDLRQRALVEDWVLAQTQGLPPVVDCGLDGGPIFTIWQQSTYPERCTPYGTEVGQDDAFLFSGLQTAQQEEREKYERLLTSGARPLGICDPEGALSPGVKNQPELCPSTFIVSVSAKDIESASQTAQQRVLTIDADAIGESVDNLVADLLEEIFTVVEDEAESGLQRLISKRLSGTSGRSGGSYLDRLAGGAPNEEQGRNYLGTNIVNSIGVETSYQELTTEVIEGLTTTIDTFEQIRVCYAGIGAGPTPNASITKEDALLRAENASSTINRLLAPQLAAHQENLANSQSVVNDLAVLVDEVRAGTDATEINATAESYDGLREVGLLRSDADLQYFIEDAGRFLESLALGQQDAEAQLAQCQSFNTATPTI